MRIGLDLGGTKIEGVILDREGIVVEKIRIDTPRDDYKKILESLCQVVNNLQSMATDSLTVGIGTPGALSTSTAIMKNSNSVCLNGHPLKADIEEQLGYAVRIENDANCFTLSEALHGAARHARTVFGVILGTGTGGGIVIEKNLLSGPNSIAGEWGHNSLPGSAMKVHRSDRQCYCGRENCIETFLSGRGLVQTHLELHGANLPAEEIAGRASEGDEFCETSINIYCQQLAHCLATIVNVIDPHMIVLGGGLSNIQMLYQVVREYLEPIVFTDKLLTQISPPAFGDASGARGAACLWPLN